MLIPSSLDRSARYNLSPLLFRSPAARALFDLPRRWSLFSDPSRLGLPQWKSMNTGMAKRELSSTLKNLKFMQRAAPREEKPKEEKENPDPDGRFFSAAAAGATSRRRCIVLMEGDPHPGALSGRMSFQSFNPSIDKLNEDTTIVHQMQASSMSNENGSISDRLQEKLVVRSEEPKCSSQENNSDADLKRKQAVVETEIPARDKFHKTETGSLNGKSSQQNPSSSHKKQKREKLNWSLLKPPKDRKKKT